MAVGLGSAIPTEIQLEGSGPARSGGGQDVHREGSAGSTGRLFGEIRRSSEASSVLEAPSVLER